MLIHPKIDDESGLAYGPWEEGWKDVSGYEQIYEVNHEAMVRNKKTGRILKPHLNRIKLSDGKGGVRKKPIYHIVLESFFPHIQRNGRTADHIDEIHNNHHISNLWWQTPRQQIIKSIQLQPRNHNAAALSKAVEQWSTKTPKVKLQTFVSSIEAERQTGISQSSISNCARGVSKTAGGFHWRFQIQKYLDGEKWGTNEALVAALQERNPKKKLKKLAQVRISNFGRVQTMQGIITKGSNENGEGGYRLYGGWRVHQLVWIVWGDGRPIPRAGEDLVIMHNDEIDKDEDKCVSNAITNLKLGTKSENAVAYHRAKAKKRIFSKMSEEK